MNFVLRLCILVQSNNLGQESKIKFREKKKNLGISNRRSQSVPKTSSEGLLRDIVITFSKGRPWEVDSGHSWMSYRELISRPSQDVRLERSQDGQIGSLGDVLGTFEGDVLCTS